LLLLLLLVVLVLGPYFLLCGLKLRPRVWVKGNGAAIAATAATGSLVVSYRVCTATAAALLLLMLLTLLLLLQLLSCCCICQLWRYSCCFCLLLPKDVIGTSQFFWGVAHCSTACYFTFRPAASLASCAATAAGSAVKCCWFLPGHVNHVSAPTTLSADAFQIPKPQAYRSQHETDAMESLLTEIWRLRVCCGPVVWRQTLRGVSCEASLQPFNGDRS
jgi:hypothetical protein